MSPASRGFRRPVASSKSAERRLLSGATVAVLNSGCWRHLPASRKAADPRKKTPRSDLYAARTARPASPGEQQPVRALYGGIKPRLSL